MSEGAMTKEEFVQGMKTLREEAAAKEEARKAKHEYNRKYAEKKKAEKAAETVEKAEAVADPEGVELTREEAAMLSQYIKDTICHALDGDYYFNETMIFDLVHLSDRLGGAE